jgi:hypothetical protein
MPRGGLTAARAAIFADGHVGRPPAKDLCRGPSEALGKVRIFFCFFPSFFLGPSYSKYIPNLKVGTILSFFAIFCFFCLNFFGNSNFGIFHYFMYLQFKFGVAEKIQTKKLTKYRKKLKIVLTFAFGSQKKTRKKKTKKIFLLC